MSESGKYLRVRTNSKEPVARGEEGLLGHEGPLEYICCFVVLCVWGVV